MQRLISLLLPLMAFLLQSCIEGDEEIWINGDGSGKVIVHYSLPSLALGQMGAPDDYVRAIRMVDDREEGIQVQKISFQKIDGKAVFHMEASFDEATDLLELGNRNESIFVEEAHADPRQLHALAGKIDVALSGLRSNFHRSVSLGPIVPSMVQSRPAMLGQSTFKYTLHLPVEIIESNAHHISDDGRTISWKFLLKDAIDKPMIMSAKVPIPRPWWVWLLLALLTFTLAFLLWKKFISRAKPAQI